MSEAFAILSGALDEAINDTKTKKLPRNVRSIEIEPAGVYSAHNRQIWKIFLCI